MKKLFVFAALFITMISGAWGGELLLLNIEDYNSVKIDALRIFDSRPYIIIEADNATKEALKEANIDFKIVDSNPWNAGYYCVFDPYEVKEIGDEFGEILVRHENWAVIKTTTPNFAAMNRDRLDFYQINRPVRQLNYNHQFVAPDISSLNASRVDIASLVDLVSADNIETTVQELQDFVTRYYKAANREQVVQYLISRFESYGYDNVEIDSYYLDNTWSKNVYVTIEGSTYPEEYIVIGGHWDSVVYEGDLAMYHAPGADDNASAVACVYELARIFKEQGYEPKRSIILIAFAQEELSYDYNIPGLQGSTHFAQVCYEAGMDIKLMMNDDMIATNNNEPGTYLINYTMHNDQMHVYDLHAQIADEYTELTAQLSGGYSCDDRPFYERGWETIFYAEEDFSPHWHQPTDSIQYCDIDYCAEVTKLNVAAAIYNAQMSSRVEELIIMDAGTGNSLCVDWDYQNFADLANFNIAMGTQSGIYDQNFQTNDTEYTITGLTEGTEYFVGVSAISDEGIPSFIAEVSCIPMSAPHTPEDFVLENFPAEIQMYWTENTDLDLAGYNVYREDEQETVVLLNGTPITEAHYTDETAVSGVFYHYYIKAVDNDGYESESTPEIGTYLLSVDQGILLVDATYDGPGGVMNPSDEECDAFYAQLLRNFDYDVVELSDIDNLNMNEYGKYNIIFIYNDGMNYHQNIAEQAPYLTRYLDNGGQILMSGYKPTAQFTNNSAYPRDFYTGDFVYDYLKIDHSDLDNASRFRHTTNSSDMVFEDIYTDPEKALPPMNNHILLVESIWTQNDEENTLFAYGSEYEQTDPFGSMSGDPVGVYYFGDDFKTVTISFPLFAMEADDAREFIVNLFTNHFGEILDINPKNSFERVSGKALAASNHPNPFNPLTSINFELPEQGSVTLTVYNVMGQVVRTLINDEIRNAGSHSISWDGTNDLNEGVSSGIYFYRLDAGDSSVTKKMLLMK